MNRSSATANSKYTPRHPRCVAYNFRDQRACVECRLGCRSHRHPDGTARVLSGTRVLFYHRVDLARGMCSCEWGRNRPGRDCIHLKIARYLWPTHHQPRIVGGSPYDLYDGDEWDAAEGTPSKPRVWRFVAPGGLPARILPAA